eukprot:421522-Rhodomonas_salina.1
MYLKAAHFHGERGQKLTMQLESISMTAWLAWGKETDCRCRRCGRAVHPVPLPSRHKIDQLRLRINSLHLDALAPAAHKLL